MSRFRFGRFIAGLILGLDLLSGAAAQAQLSPLNPTVDQNGTIGFVALSGDQRYCGTQPYDNTWSWTISGGAGGWISTGVDQPVCSLRTFQAFYAPGTYTLTVTHGGQPFAATNVTVRSASIALSGPSEIFQTETGRYTAILSGVAPDQYSNTWVTWSLSPAGANTLQPDSSSPYPTQYANVVAGTTAGDYVLTAATSFSRISPPATRQIAVHIDPPPQAIITPSATTFAAGQTVGFNVSIAYSTDQRFSFGSDDPYQNFPTVQPNGFQFVHSAFGPGGTYHIFAQSVRGGTPGTSTITVVNVAASPTPVVVPAGTTRQFTAKVTGSQQAVQWSTNVPGGTISSGGLLTVPPGAANGSYTVTAQTVGIPPATSTASVTVGPIPVARVTVAPTSGSVVPGETIVLSHYVEGQLHEAHPNQAVTWSISGPGSPTISAAGAFTAPNAAGTYVATARSVADPSKAATASLTETASVVVSPAWSTLAPGASQVLSAHVIGMADGVSWSVKEGAAGGTVTASGLYTAPSTAGSFHVVARSNVNPSIADTATLTVVAGAPVSVTVAPDGVELTRGATLLFTAAVEGAANPEVVWSASDGTIDASGLFTAPSHFGTAIVTATSAADSRIAGEAVVVISDGGAGQAFTYDANGNVLSDGTRTFEWDAENRLTAVSTGTHRSEFGYDALGRRVLITEKDAGSVSSRKRYVWVGAEIAEERDARATPPVQSLSSPASLERESFDAALDEEDAPDRARPMAATTAGNDSVFSSQSVPTAMIAGGVYQVSLAFTNTGRTTWTTAANYHLGSQNPPDNTVWGPSNRVFLASGESVAPGQTKSFTFTVKAPASPGTYNLQWKMVQDGVEWFGAPSTNVAVSVVAGSTTQLAQFLSQSVPKTMVAGGVYQVSIVYGNAGTAVWTAAANYRLGSNNPLDNSTWGAGRVYLASSDSIAQGQIKTFTFNVRAPAAAGTYNFEWQMLQEGVTRFGDPTPNVAVTIVSASTAQLAEFISQAVPATMSTGQRYTVSITMENAGSTSWTESAHYHLGSQNPQDNQTFGVGRAFLGASESIAQGQTKTFTFTVTAPWVPGTYNFQWRMVQDGVAWFGDSTPNIPIQVSIPPEPVLARFFPEGLQTGGVNYYYTRDHLGSIREVTDATGNVVGRYDYDAYGRVTVVQGMPLQFGFAGYFFHQPSGLNLTWARAYDPDLGRWESTDPIEEAGGANLYEYGLDDPVNSDDPLGLRCRPRHPKHPRPKHPNPKKPHPKKPGGGFVGPPRPEPPYCPGGLLCAPPTPPVAGPNPFAPPDPFAGLPKPPAPDPCGATMAGCYPAPWTLPPPPPPPPWIGPGPRPMDPEDIHRAFEFCRTISGNGIPDFCRWMLRYGPPDPVHVPE